MAMAFSLTPRTWRIAWLCATVAAKEDTDGQACRLLRLAEFALDLSRLAALRGHRQKARCRRHYLAGRFRLGVRGLRRSAAAQTCAAAPSLSHDGAEALARPSRRQAEPPAQAFPVQRSARRQVCHRAARTGPHGRRH